jgi:hypothetical protein
VRRLLSPSWLLRHALAIFLVGLFARLGWWQLVKGQSDHGSLQNLFYGFEWPVFAGAVLFFWWKMVREQLKPSAAPGPPTEPGTIAPTAAVAAGDVRAGAEPGRPRTGLADAGLAGRRDDGGDDDHDEDFELAAYNRYLASLYESGARGAGR